MLRESPDNSTAASPYPPVALSYFPCGSYLAFLLHSFNTLDRVYYFDNSFIWALSLAIISACVCALILVLFKTVVKRIVWLHYYLLAIGSVFLLASGIVLITNNTWWVYGKWFTICAMIRNIITTLDNGFIDWWSPDYSTSTALGGIGHGAIYISGMAYIHVRTNSYKHRVARVALCHLTMIIGMVATISYMAWYMRWYSIFGYFITYSAVSNLALFLINELLHALGLFDYKKCLDHQLREADEKRDRMHSALLHTNVKRNTSKQVGLTITAILSKFLSSLMYNNIILYMALVTQGTAVGLFGTKYAVVYYFMLGGVIIGMIVSLRTKIKHQYPALLAIKFICLVIAGICFATESYTAAFVFFWLFYLWAAATVFIPDVAIMEVSNIKMYEINLFLGFAVEQIPIMVSIYIVRERFWFLAFQTSPMWTYIGIGLGLAVLVSIVFIVVYPNTFHLRVLQIQRLIMYGQHTGGPFAQHPNPIPNPGPMSTMPYAPMPAAHAPNPMPNLAPMPQQHAMPVMPPMTYAPMPAVAPQSQFPGQASGSFSAQPLFHGQQPVYMVPQYPYYAPVHAAAAAPSPADHQPSASAQKSAEASAPQLTPVTETEQVLWQSQQEMPPPAYGQRY